MRQLSDGVRAILYYDTKADAGPTRGWTVTAIAMPLQFGFAMVKPLGHGKLIPVGPHLRQLLDQLLFESVQLRTTRGDPFLYLGVHHAPERTSGADPDGRGPA
ncbi:hypothetical protein ACWDV7_08560 [Streptomyces sp. NPDC003362]